MILVSIDPGKHHAGWAIFVEKMLVRAGVAKVKPQKDTHGPYFRQGKHKQVQAQSAVMLAELIGAHVAVARRIVGDNHVIDVVCEFMHVYLDDDGKLVKGTSSPEDLLYVQNTAGAVMGEIRAPKRVRHVEANEWKKQRSDAATWPWIRNVMTPAEVEVAKACGIYDAHGPLGANFHHGLEAYGIGAWAQFRL